MVSQKFTVKNKSGLHARPAAVMAKAGKCRSEVLIKYGDRIIQAKSILNIMAAAIQSGAEIEVQCTGETEEEDLKTLGELIESGLGE